MSKVFNKLKADPDNKILQLRYVQQFPSNTKHFKRLFDPEDFSELYDGYKYIFLIKDLIKDHPLQVGCVLINISKEAKWNADAFYYLQKVTAFFASNHTSVFVKILETYEFREQDQVISFLADGIHSTVKEYGEIVEQLRKLDKESLARRMEQIEQRISLTRRLEKR